MRGPWCVDSDEGRGRELGGEVEEREGGVRFARSGTGRWGVEEDEPGERAHSGIAACAEGGDGAVVVVRVFRVRRALKGGLALALVHYAGVDGFAVLGADGVRLALVGYA